MKRIYFLFVLLSFTTISRGQYSLSTSSYTQNFNGLGIGTSAGVTSGDLNLVNPTLDGWYFLELGTSANTTITAGTGSSGTADTYNFGAAGNADRTLGGLRFGSDVSPTLNPRFGFYFTNNTGSDIEALQISYTGETWRRGFDNRRDRLDFQYSTNATSLSTGIWTNVDGLDYSNPVSPLPIGSGSVLHSATINSVILNITIADGASFFIRWIDLDATDNDDGMGINDFTMTVVDPTPVVFYSKSTGNLTDVSTWGDDPSGSGTAPANFTNNFQEFNLVNRLAATLNANWIVSGVNSKVIVGDGISAASLTIPSSSVLTGVVDVLDLAIVRLENNTLPNFGTLSDGSTVNFAQTGTYTLPIGTFSNLNITGGSKTLGNGNTIVTGNMVLDGVTSLNGWTGGSSSTIILTGNLSLQNGAAFAATGTLPALEMVGSGTQTLSGGNIRVRSLQTTNDPVNLNILLSNANLTLTGFGLELIESTHTLSLNGNTLFMQGGSTFGSSGDNLGSISGSSTSVINIFRSSSNGGSANDLRMTPGAQVLGTLEYRDVTSDPSLSLASPLSISTTIIQHLNDDINTSSANLLTLLQGAEFTGPGVGSAFVIGPVARVTNTATAYRFPVGGKTIFLQIPTPGNTSTFRMEYFETGIHTTVFPCDMEPLSGFKINEYWDITRTSGTSPASFSIEFDGQNLSSADWNQGVPEDGDGIVIAHYVEPIIIGGVIPPATSDCWENVSPSAPILPFPQTTLSTEILNDFSPFTFGYIDFGPPLPVKFGNVKAYQQGNNIKIDWSNFTESDVVNYTIEHSANGRDFIPLAAINANKNDGSRADYSYLDVAPFNGLNFYRIQSLETDGKKLYSVIVRVSTKNNSAITIYPNPVIDGVLVLQTQDLKRGAYTINVLNAVGQRVYSNTLNHSGGFITQSIQLSSSLKPGLYTIQLVGNDTRINKLFIKR